MTEVTAEPLSEAADGRERGAEKYAGSLYNYKTKRRDEKKKGGMIAMKKFLSMVMAAAMVVSLVPATAFAAKDDVRATARVVDAENYTQDEIKAKNSQIKGPEVQLRFTTASYTSAQHPKAEYTFTLDNATWDADIGDAGTYSIVADNVTYWKDQGVFKDSKGNELLDADGEEVKVRTVNKPAVEAGDEDELEIEITGKMDYGWVLAVDLTSTMDKTSKGRTATVTVESSDVRITNGDDLVYASVEAAGIDVSIKDTTDIAVEEIATLEKLTIEPSVGANFAAIVDTEADSKAELKLRLNSGFEFTKATKDSIKINDVGVAATVDDNEIIIKADELKKFKDVDEWEITGLEVEAVSAKAGTVGTIRVSLTGSDTVSVEAINVVDYVVEMSVDEDEDVPVIYSGVDVKNTGITDDSDHESLEVTIEETFAGAWNNSKDFTLSVPEGVYIVDVVNPTMDNNGAAKPNNAHEWFEEAYEEGNYVDLTFEKRTWDESDPEEKDDPIELTFTLVLVADPNFEGDVVLKLTGDAVDEQEVTIAKFVKPFTVKAEQNDMKIDYRNTEIPTSVVITEAEAGLWDKDTVFKLALDKIEFDDEGSISVDDKSGLEIKDDEVKADSKGVLSFTVDGRSDDEPASVTISGMQLYMDRSLPAGAYDLDVYSSTMLGVEKDEFGADDAREGYLQEEVLGMLLSGGDVDCIADINDDFVSYTAKAGFVNIVTAGREDDDSSFTTKVVVPVGENYLIAGENQIALDVPAYISADGYTMLPIRAVAYALGINTNSVLWDQPSRTVTIMYGSRIISMQNGQSVMYVSGQAIPMSGAVEIVDGRAFIPMRDLGVALGVTDIAWDAATRTATLNGSK